MSALEARQPPGAGKCFLCGAPEVSPEAHFGSPVCGECLPITEHVVSMQTGAGGTALAVCQCGWRSVVRHEHRASVQQAQVRMHWRDAIRRKLEEFDAEFGAGAAARELAGFALAVAIGANATVAISLIADALGAWA